MKDLINHSDILIIMTAWKEFKKIDQPYLNKNLAVIVLLILLSG